MNGPSAYAVNLLNMIDFKPLLESHNNDTIENLKGGMYSLYHWSPVVSGDELYEYLRTRYPEQLQFSIRQKTNAYHETYNEYVILYGIHSQKADIRGAFKKLACDMIDCIDDVCLDKIVSEFNEKLYD